jgi:hypothetical protein
VGLITHMFILAQTSVRFVLLKNGGMSPIMSLVIWLNPFAYQASGLQATCTGTWSIHPLFAPQGTMVVPLHLGVACSWHLGTCMGEAWEGGGHVCKLGGHACKGGGLSTG